jgi:hypothetical protein
MGYQVNSSFAKIARIKSVCFSAYALPPQLPPAPAPAPPQVQPVILNIQQNVAQPG